MIRFWRVSVTNTSPVGVRASQRGRSRPAAKTFTSNPAGTLSDGLAGIGMTFGDFEALFVAKGCGRSARVIRIGAGVSGFVATRESGGAAFCALSDCEIFDSASGETSIASERSGVAGASGASRALGAKVQPPISRIDDASARFIFMG